MSWAKAVLTTVGLLLFTSTARGDTDTVLVRDFNFFPASLTIRPGDKVVWKFIQACCIDHTVTRTASPMSWNSGSLAVGETFELVFPTAGTFAYHCIPHQAIGMTGSITVEPIRASTLGWLGLFLLAASLTAAGIYVLGYKRQSA
ncbi:MAG: plastocyanin/azurin family copper-binding protein [candidate division Zixibacteria bacterium]|nr:plastocyanin/azurin family copper-binding protein [candidate division Zixibacteria bacterium]